MKKCNKEDSHVANSASCHSNDLTKSYKPIKLQYFTFGKDNCLVHHPTTQSKKSSPNAIFCKTNPFSTPSQANKTCHKKVKSTLQTHNKQEKFTTQANAIKKDTISKITRNLKQPQASSVSDSDFHSIVVRGKSLKLEPKNHFEISTCCASGYCPSIKRCKMCGEIMLNIQSSVSSFTKENSSSGSCSVCLDKATGSIVCKEKVKNVSHQHNPIIKRCVICLKLFRQPSSSIVCEKCPTIVRTKEHVRGPVPSTKGKIFPSETNLERKAKNVMSSRLREDYVDTLTKYKASQSAKCNKLPSKSKDTLEDLLQVRALSSKQQLKTKVNVSVTNVSTENSFKPMQTKLSAEANHLTTKPKSTTEKASSKSYVYIKQCKNTNVTSGKTKVASMPTYSKSLKSNLASKCKSVPDETTQEVYHGTKHFEHNATANKIPSVEKSNMSNQTKSLPENSQLATSNSNANELLLKSYFAPEQHKNTNLDYEAAFADKSSRSIQTNSFAETNLDITFSDNSSESFTSEGYFNREHSKNSNMDRREGSTEESNTTVQTHSLSETSQQKSKSDPESYPIKQSKNINQTDKVDSVEAPIHAKSLQLDQDFPSKISTDLILHHNNAENSKEENLSQIPVLQNVTVNTYYYLTGCDLKEKFPNPPVAYTTQSFSTTKHSSSESISLSSEIEDSLEIDKLQDKQNKLSFDNQACCGHLKSPSLQLEFPKSVSEKLDGVFKQNTDDFLSNIFKLQHDKMFFYKDAHSALENDTCPPIDRICELSSNFYVGRQEMSFQNLSLCAEKEFQNYTQDAQSLYGTKTNPYIQKSVMIFEEMDNIRNEPIDPKQILEELKQNPKLMKSITQMAAKKLNFSRKATVFKNLRFK